MVKVKYPKYAKAFRGKLPPEITDIIGKYVRRAVIKAFREKINHLVTTARRRATRSGARQFNRQRFLLATGTRGPYGR